MSDFTKSMAITDEQLAHNLRVWNQDQKKLEQKLAKKEAKRKFCNTQLADSLRGVVAKKKS